MVTLLHGDNLELLRELQDNSIDAIVCDPPYGLGTPPDAMQMLRDWMQFGAHEVKSKRGFMGKSWDNFVPQPAQWMECRRVLKPGGHVLAFAGTRTQDLMALGLRIAGFEIRDMVAWVYGSGFPKSHNLSDEWEGWGTALKPALEPITLARKPLEGTVAQNVLAHGVGAMNIDGCRIATSDELTTHSRGAGYNGPAMGRMNPNPTRKQHGQDIGRWPANLTHDGSEEVLAGFPESKGQQGDLKNHDKAVATSRCLGAYGPKKDHAKRDCSGSAARFFYCAKVSASERNEGCENLESKEWAAEGACIPERDDRPFNPSKNNHPTLKPIALMRYLCRLITPPGGMVLDPWMGSGSTGKAAQLEGFDFIGMEQDTGYFKIAQARCGVKQEEEFVW